MFIDMGNKKVHYTTLKTRVCCFAAIAKHSTHDFFYHILNDFDILSPKLDNYV